MKRRKIAIAVLFLVIAALACNAPDGRSDEPPPTVTPFVPEAAPTTEPPPPGPTESVEPTEGPPPPTNTPEPAATTEPPSPTATTRPVSAGPLSYRLPLSVSSAEPLGNGANLVTIMVYIEGGAPPFVIHHDVDTYVTGNREFPLQFEYRGCGALVHNITIESGDGQTFSEDYWIPDTWCAP